MIAGIIGSKDQLINEYRVMLAEKLFNKTDYEIDTEIRTLELLKIYFGESSMQKCGIMLNDLIISKRTNTNVVRLHLVLLMQQSYLRISGHLFRMKLELEFEDRTLQFTVTPVLASIIMQFQDQTSWTSKNLAAAIGVPVDTLHRRINFWITKGIVAESSGGESNDHLYTLVDCMTDGGKTTVNNEELIFDEDVERSVASVEDQLRKEMTVYEKLITGMLTNFGNMALDRIHNSLKVSLDQNGYDGLLGVA